MAFTDPIAIPKTQEGQIRDLRRLIQTGHAKLVGPDGQQVAIPETVHNLLLSILENLQAGRAISIVPERQYLTTQRASWASPWFDFSQTARFHSIWLDPTAVSACAIYWTSSTGVM